jgi:hypothetical protein
MLWDVVVTVTLMAFGAVALIAICGLIGWAIFFIQNGGRDDR